MNYTSRYPGLFGGAKSRRAPIKPPIIPVPEPVVVEPEPEPDTEEALDVEALAQQLADDYKVSELKERADRLGIEYKTSIRELDLATLIAEYELNQGE